MRVFLVLLAVVGGLINGESNTTALLPPRLATNSSQHVSSTSLYCNSSTMTGHWEYGTNESTDFSKCKVERWCKTNDKIHVQIDRQMINYACSSYRRATYIPPPHCSLLSTAESLSVLKLNLRPGSFVFVGDSLMLQQYMAAQCAFADEDIGHNPEHSTSTSTTSSFSPQYIFNSFLRPNIPCEAICLQNTSFRLGVKGHFPDPCSGCPEGKAISSAPPHHSAFRRGGGVMAGSGAKWWMHDLPVNTRVLIISTGAWYNKFQGVDHGSNEYHKTLLLLKPIFQHLIKTGILVVWLALPPLVDDISWKKGDFGWEEFGANNARAFQSFQSIGVIFIDIQLILLERKLFDPRISPDGLHWCNVGETGVPSFMNQIIFHEAALASELLRKKIT